MTVVQASVEIDASPAAVWRVVSDPRNLPRWDRHIIRVADLPPNGVRAGSTYTTHLRYMGVPARIRAEVVELRPEEYSRVDLRGVLDATVETWLQPIEGNRTLLRQRVSYRFKGGPLGRVVARAIRRLGATRELRNGVRAQKRQVEGPGSKPSGRD